MVASATLRSKKLTDPRIIARTQDVGSTQTQHCEDSQKYSSNRDKCSPTRASVLIYGPS